MTKVNYTIEDRSPLLRYAPPGAWRLGNSASDPLANKYSGNGTFTLTTTTDASATFTFNGTGVWIFGAKRSNHGPYQVNLDNDIYDFDGFSSDPQFQIPLFAAPNIVKGLHTVTITNKAKNASFPFLDIDFVTWTADVNNSFKRQFVFSHTSPSFQYEPSSAWSQPVLSGFNSTTGHTTTTSNASASYMFSGSTISIFGAVSADAGPYSVQLDDRQPQNFNGTVPDYTPQTLLYFADNMGPGLHTVKLVNLPSTPGTGLFIDYALVREGQPATTPRKSTSHGLSTGATAAIAVGVVVALLVCIGLAVFCWRKRAKKRRRRSLIIEDRSDPPPPESMVYTPYVTNASTQSQLLPAPDSASTSDLHDQSMSQASAVSSSRVMYTANRTSVDAPPMPANTGYPPEKRSLTALSPTPQHTQYIPVSGEHDVDHDLPPSYEQLSRGH